jgi:hypothetical protein
MATKLSDRIKAEEETAGRELAFNELSDGLQTDLKANFFVGTMLERDQGIQGMNNVKNYLASINR